MKNVATMLVVAVVALLAVPAAFAQEAGAAGAQHAGANWSVITAGFGMAVAAAFCGLAQSRVGAAACEGIARNPGATDVIRGAMLLALVFIESLVLFTFGMIFLKA